MLKRRKLLRHLFILVSILGVLCGLGNGFAQAAQDAQDDDAVDITPQTQGTTGELSGDVVVSFVGQDTQTWEAMCAAYTALHPNVNCTVELKPNEGYQEFVRTQFAAGTPEFSFVNGNVVADLVNAKQFLDLSAYLDRENPYSGRTWREDFDPTALANMRDPLTGEMYLLNTETVQVLWFYNKAAFEKAGILADAEAVAATPKNQPTWDQLLGWCDQLSEAGYIPVAIEGDFTSFWQFRVGWLARMYADQFTRHEAELVRCQEGDYCFREGIDDQWVYDPSDPSNDDSTRVTFNPVRKMIALQGGQQSVDNEAWGQMYENFKAFGERCAPPGWIGTTDAYPLFLTGQAAIRLDIAGLLSSFERDIRSLAEGTYTSAAGDSEEKMQAAASVFDIGTFNNPTMEGGAVDAPARTIEVNIGFWSIPRKDQAQNDLEVDFMMFATSPEGAGLYLQNKLDPDNLGSEGINGPLALRDVQLPADLAERFEGLRLIGNTEKDTAGNYRARGVNDYQPSVRAWVDLAHQYFLDEITLEQFLSSYEQSLKDNFDGILEHSNLTPDDLNDPSRKPANF